MDSSPINPLVQLQSAAAVGRETQPVPTQLANLPPDSLIDAVVLRQEPGHIVKLESKLGIFRIKVEIDLLRHMLRDSTVSLRFLSQDNSTQARIVTINGTPINQLPQSKSGQSSSVIIDSSAKPTQPITTQATAPAAAPRPQTNLTQQLPNPTTGANTATIAGVTSTANPNLQPLQTLSVTLAGGQSREQASLLVGLLSSNQAQSAPPPGTGQHVLIRLYQLAESPQQPPNSTSPAAPNPSPTLAAAPKAAQPFASPATASTTTPSTSTTVATPTTNASANAPANLATNTLSTPTSPVLTTSTSVTTTQIPPSSSIITPPNNAPTPNNINLQTTPQSTSTSPNQATTAPPTAGTPTPTKKAVHAYQHQSNSTPRPLLPATIMAQASSSPTPSTAAQATPAATGAPPFITLTHAAGQFQLPTSALSSNVDLTKPIWVEVIPPDIIADKPTPRTSQWDGLRQAIQQLGASGDMAAIAPQLRALMPQPALTLPHTTLFLMTIMRGGDMRQWFGQELLDTLEQLPTTRGASSALQDISAARQVFQDTSNSPWQVLMLPMLVKDEIQPARLYMKPKKPSRDGQSETTRFVIELSLSALGTMQLDNLFTAPQKLVGNDLGDLSLTLRSNTALDNETQDDLRQLYYITLDQLGLTGRCQFVHGQPFPTAAMESVINRCLHKH